MVNLMAKSLDRANVKRNKKHDFSNFDADLHIPFMNDTNKYHTLNVLRAKENRRNICIIDIHGGSYLFNTCNENTYYASKFVLEGFDAVCLDYQPNDGKTRHTKDLIDDTVKGLLYVFQHLKELKLENDCFVITGDSAGGHIALLLAEALSDPGFAKELGYDFNNIKIEVALVNSPVYDFAAIGDEFLTEKAMIRMFGPHYNDEKLNKLVSPKEHLDSLNMPLFVSTCKNDFLRGESLKLKEDLELLKKDHQFIDIDSDEKNVNHVHNVVYPELKESIQVNNAMIDFIMNNLK